VVQLGIGELALAGATGAQLLVMLTIVGAGVQLLDDLPGSVTSWLEDAIDALPRGTGVVIAAAVLLAPLWVGLAALASILTDYGYTLTSTERELHLRRGLLDQREATVALHRVQALRIEQSLLRRLVGRAALMVQSASAGASANPDADVSRVRIPLVRVGELERVVGTILPGASPLPPLEPAPVAARRRAIVRRVLPFSLVALAISLLLWPWGALAFVVVPLAWVGGALAYRGLGHAATAEHVTARSGAVLRQTVIVPVRKAQSTRLRTSPMQRRAGLATLYVDVAGRGPTPRVFDGDAVGLDVLRDSVASSSRPVTDEAAVRSA
jgi:putative membrane protein